LKTGRYKIQLIAVILLLTATGPVYTSARTDYLLHCAGCHLPQGKGVPPEVPTLVGSLGRIAASEEGRDYIARVPGASQAPISDAQLAAVLNWVLLEFNSETLPESFRPLTAREVGKSRSRVLSDPLKMRRTLWPDSAEY
jgi:hypothetical protein